MEYWGESPRQTLETLIGRRLPWPQLAKAALSIPVFGDHRGHPDSGVRGIRSPQPEDPSIVSLGEERDVRRKAQETTNGRYCDGLLRTDDASAI